MLILNCDNCGWLNTVNDDGFCPVCGKFVSDNGEEIHIIEDEMEVEDEG